MKKASLFAALFALLFTLCFSCRKTSSASTSCSTTTDSSVRGKLLHDNINITSPYYGEVIGTFTFTIKTVHFSGSSSCPSDSVITNLIVANSITKTITVDFDFLYEDVAGKSCGIGKYYRTTIKIPALSYIDLGRVSADIYRKDLDCIPSFDVFAISYE